MNCTKDCEEYEKPSVMLQGTSGIRPGGGDVAKCRKLSRLVIMIWWYSNIIDTKTNQKLTRYTSWGGQDNIDDVAKLVGPLAKSSLTTFPTVAFTQTSLSWSRTSRLFSSSITPFTCIKFIFHVAVKERAINNHDFVLVHTSHTRSSVITRGHLAIRRCGENLDKDSTIPGTNSLTAFRPTAVTSEEFLSVTKLLMITLRTGSRQSGGTISWAACAENKSNLMNSHWWRARSLQYFNFRF